MKKIFVLFVAMFVLAATANASSMIKSYYTYTIKNHKLKDTVEHFESVYAGDSNVKKLTGTPNAYYSTWKNDKGEIEHYYTKLYPAMNNTDIYVVSDAEYSKDDNELTRYFKANGIKYKHQEDKEALREYKFDFIDYARTGNLDGLFSMPDCFKPLKTGMGKINDKISKNSKKTSAIPYTVDNDPINLTKIDSNTYIDEDAQVSVTVNEYRLKNKENKYAHAYEYLVSNNGNTSLNVNKVTSERVASLKDITTQTFVDLDKLDLIDTVGSFPPVAVCTGGVSLLCSVPNWVRLAKVTKEATRFAHTLPENQTIKPGSKMRVLVLKFKNDPKPLNFNTTRDGVNYNFTF